MLTKAINEYLDHLDGRAVSSHTLKAYRTTLQQFASRFKELSVENVERFIGGFQPTTANAHLVRLRGLARRMKIDLNDVERLKEPQPLREALTEKQLHRLIAYLVPINPEVAMAVEFLGKTGLRMSEFTSLTRDSLRTQDGIPYLLIYGKGRKERQVPLNELTLRLFNDLPLPWVMPDHKFRSILTEAEEESGEFNVHIHPHLLRASAASILINEKGIDGLLVAQIMGWSKVDTLHKHYLRTDLKRLAAVI